MKSPFCPNKRAFISFVLGSLLFYLSAAYFGGVYISLARFWFVLYILDVLILLINVFTLRYFVDFSKDHICKGDTIIFSTKIQRGTWFPVPCLEIEPSKVHARQDDTPASLLFSLNSGKVWVYKREVHATLRGIYTLGLSRITVKSFSGILSVDLPLWVRSFYVYPRLFDMTGILTKHRSQGGRSRALAGTSGEAYMFEGLREYRQGESVRDISWSAFMRRGFPVLKIFSSRGGSDIHLFIDRRDSRRSPICDDTVLEIFLSLVNTAIHSGQKLVVHGYPGWENRRIITYDEFQKLYKTTLTLEFDSLGLDGLDAIPSEGALYVVSALPDLALLDEYSRLAAIDHLIAVTTGMEDEKLNGVRSLILTLKMNGANITEINSAEHLEEDLACLFSF